jgi:fumarylacetoacetase
MNKILRSWVESANDSKTDFPIQNLPFGRFRHGGGPPRTGVAIGDRILDLERSGLQTYHRPRIMELLAFGAPHIDLLPMSDCEMVLPFEIGDYTDFYASIHHAMNVGRLFRPDNPLLPNYKYVPIAYHGRASSIVVSGTPIRRPCGQVVGSPPTFGPTKRLDYELEVGFFAGAGNPVGQPIPIANARDHIFGFCLVNDWSARDIQAWEYQPLGPFLAKSFATTISPWVVTAEALEPFRVPAYQRPEGDPAPLPYLNDAEDQASGAYDIWLEVWIQRANASEPVLMSRGNFRDMYWTVAQMVAHHTSNGCNLRHGDLIASGTVSGPDPEARGCLLELGSQTFLQDGDEVILRGRCEREGAVSIGFGECRGRITPALVSPLQ